MSFKVVQSPGLISEILRCSVHIYSGGSRLILHHRPILEFHSPQPVIAQILCERKTTERAARQRQLLENFPGGKREPHAGPDEAIAEPPTADRSLAPRPQSQTTSDHAETHQRAGVEQGSLRALSCLQPAHCVRPQYLYVRARKLRGGRHAWGSRVFLARNTDWCRLVRGSKGWFFGAIKAKQRILRVLDMFRHVPW